MSWGELVNQGEGCRLNIRVVRNCYATYIQMSPVKE